MSALFLTDAVPEAFVSKEAHDAVVAQAEENTAFLEKEFTFEWKKEVAELTAERDEWIERAKEQAARAQLLEVRVQGLTDLLTVARGQR